MLKLKYKIQKMIEEIIDRLVQEQINPLQAVRLIDNAIGGVQGVQYRKNMTIESPTDRESVSTKGLNRKQMKFLVELAALAYLQAQQNGSLRPGEVHLNRGLSTKHYSKEFKEYAGALMQKYAA